MIESDDRSGHLEDGEPPPEKFGAASHSHPLQPPSTSNVVVITMHTTTVLSWLLVSFIGAGALHVTLLTATAECNLKFHHHKAEGILHPHRIFLLESALSTLFHAGLSAPAGSEKIAGGNSRVLATSVHIRRMGIDDTEAVIDQNSGVRGSELPVATNFTLDSVVSVTLSREDKTIPSIASLLTGAVSTRDLREILEVVDIAVEDATVHLTCADFRGSPDERGVTAARAHVMSDTTNNGWPMFFAGVAFALLAVGIVGVGAWVYKREEGRWPCAKKTADRGTADSVRYEADGDTKTAVVGMGILGAKCNAGRSPDSMVQRRRKGRTSGETADTAQGSGSPAMTVVSTTSKPPLGIAPLGKLESFRTPQKSKSDRVTMYDIERLTRT